MVNALHRLGAHARHCIYNHAVHTSYVMAWKPLSSTTTPVATTPSVASQLQQQGQQQGRAAGIEERQQQHRVVASHVGLEPQQKDFLKIIFGGADPQLEQLEQQGQKQQVGCSQQRQGEAHLSRL